NQALRVPSEASGHEARCPACREMFTIPPLDSTLEETITEWIVQDVEEMLQSKDRQVEHVPARQREPVAAGTRTKKLDVEADGTARRRLWGLRPHQPAQPDEPARDAHRAEASSPPDRDRPTHADR